jgi:hypothetical protein
MSRWAGPLSFGVRLAEGQVNSKLTAYLLIPICFGILGCAGRDDMNAERWPFEDPRNVATFTVREIVEGASPVLLVNHDNDDGAWQFLTGSEVSTSDLMIVGLGQMVKLDPSLEQLADLPLGWRAYREGPGKPWNREPIIDGHSGKVEK